MQRNRKIKTGIIGSDPCGRVNRSKIVIAIK
ncbi:MAG: hypothetical protein JWR61_407 [Ferruginibacter sp.]|nr:hypothetical protein [Ferruginibacter sp.]